MLAFAFIIAVTIAWSVRSVLRQSLAAVDANEIPTTIRSAA